MELQVILNTFASDVFRRQADFDYVAARENFRMQLRQQFLWSAQQAIEKYLKAILLFNDKSARYPQKKHPQEKPKEFNHNLAALIQEVETITIFKFELGQKHQRFLKYLDQQGQNRYLSTTAYNTGEVLQQLDETVWHIRRYCQYMPDRWLGSQEPVPGLREASVRAALNPAHADHPQLFSIRAGDLEKIVKRPSSDPTRRALVWANMFYGSSRRKRVSHRTFSSSEVPPNERGWSGVDWKAVEQYVKL